MRPICDACETSPAKVFCAADEAALCSKCDEKVHGCNKLAGRHIRLALAEASVIRRCDICENAPAFFFCGIDGTSLCLQCDMDVHVGGKRTHERYLLMGQRVEFPTSQAEGGLGKKIHVEAKVVEGGDPHILIQNDQDNPSQGFPQEKNENSGTSAIAIAIGNTASQMIDLNFRPQHETTSSIRDMELTNNEAEKIHTVVPFVSTRKETNDS